MVAEAVSRQPRVKAETEGRNLRHLEVLALLAEFDGPVGLTELADGLGIPLPSAHRLLGQLVKSGWVVITGKPRRYAPSLRVLELGFAMARANRPRNVLLDVAIPLVRKLNYPVWIGFYEQGDIVYTDWVEMRDGDVVTKVSGVRAPAGPHPGGRLLLAYRSAEEVEAALSRPLPQVQGASAVRTAEEMRAAIDAARERGYVVWDGEMGPVLSGLVVPVFGRREEAIGVLNVCIPGQLRDDVIESILGPALASAQQASGVLGFDTPFRERRGPFE